MIGRSKFVLKRLVAATVVLLFTAVGVAAQGMSATISGRVTNSAGEVLAGAQVAVTDLSTGAITGSLSGSDGRYAVPNLRPAILYKVTVQLLGYGTEIIDEVRLDAGETRTMDFELGTEAVSIAAIEVFSDRAVERQTPVAYTNVDKVQIERQLASRDIPLVLNTTPSVYSTMQGGGAGDARVNVRGFSQRNIGVMINGVPVNDMENGWVYWSNWDGVGDATSSIQLQRGLTAINLATPAIGGTLNVVTDPASMGRRLMVKQEFGNDGFLKTTATVSTGMINDKFSFMASGVRKTGDGVIAGTWTDAWAYYLAASYTINPNNRLDFFALGAPQKHGQNLYKQNIGAFSHEFARSLDDYDPDALDDYPEASSEYAGKGRFYNENYNRVSSSYTGQQYFAGKIQDRKDPDFLNERVNYFHKPQVNLNWYSQLSQNLLWSTVAYYSGGKGGGSGTYGSLVWDYSGPSRVADWDATIERNRTNADGSRGILRGSRNNQWTIGAISKLKAQVTPDFVLEVGADWRTAEIEHYRDVVDLLGGSYYRCTGGCASDFWTGDQNRLGLGDKMDYFNTNTVDWLGGFVQGEYVKDRLSTYGMLGLSTVKYTLVDHFRRDDTTNRPVELESSNIAGVQIKGGGLINVNEEVGLFANAGYVAKVPRFDDVISDVYAILNDDPKTEKYTSFEAGLNYRAMDAPVSFKGNLYYTTWNDRAQTRRFFDDAGQDFFVTMTGLNQRHMGVEFEGAWQPTDLIRFDAAASFGRWKYTDDVRGEYRVEGASEAFNYDVFIKDLKVGDAPQTQFAYALSLFPLDGLYLQAVGKTYANHYSDFNPFDRTDAADRVQSWQAPGYTLFDLHATYDVDLPTVGRRVRLFANLLNVFDEIYIQDALDNSSFNSFDDDHDADDAEVYLGLPRTFTIGVQINR